MITPNKTVATIKPFTLSPLFFIIASKLINISMSSYYSKWTLSTDPTNSMVDEINSNGIWLLTTSYNQTTDANKLTIVFFASGTGNASGAVVTVGLTAFDDLPPVTIVGASKTLAVNGVQDSLDVQFYPTGRIAVTVASLPVGTTLKAKVIQ